jgi:cyclomaltodextrinase / maltogenic alpha-amylase / neopullulanase
MQHMRTSPLIFFSILLMGVSSAAQAIGQFSPRDNDQPSFVPGWVKDAIFYQIFPERFANGNPSNDPPGTEPWGGVPKGGNYFGGDLQGIIGHLDYVSQLGVNTLYLNPIFQSNSNHKYHADDYMKIDSAFGDDGVFRRLVDSCHSRGIRIILDGVFNHSGTGFFAFQDIKKNGVKSKYFSWYNVYGLPLGPASKPNYECWWGYGDLPKLMTGNPEVRKYLFQVTEHWMRFGIDGWRLDVPNEIPHDFWIEWRKLVKSLNPNAYIVGEIWDDAKPWLQGDQFDAVMNYKFRSACLDFFVERKTTAVEFDSSLADIRDRYADDVNFVMQNLLGSHDTERLLTLCKNDKEVMKLAWLFQMTYQGAPMVYYGDEVGLTGGKDPACRHTMLWESSEQDRNLLEYMKGLVKLRREHSWLRRGSFETLPVDAGAGVFAFMRTDDSGKGIVVLNNEKTPQSVKIQLDESNTGMHWQQVWPAEETHENQMNNQMRDTGIDVRIPAMSGIVFSVGRGQ